MLNFGMNGKNLLSYLYLIDENDGIDGKFFDKLFHSHRIHNKNNTVKLSKDFIYNNHSIIDKEEKESLRTLKFYGFVTDEHKVTAKGKEYIKIETQRNEWFSNFAQDFQDEYNGEYASENSKLKDYATRSVNCYYQDFSI